MKIPEKPPDITDVSLDKSLFSEEMSIVVKKANRDYLYWDKFKYRVPEGIRTESAWAALKTARSLQMKYVPLKDTSGRLFCYWLPDIVLQYLHLIDQDTGGQIITDNPSIYAQEKRWYLMNSIVEEAIASSQIEGAATTRQVAKDMLQTGRKPRDRSEQMVYNNYITISKIRELIDKPLTPELLKELQGSITKDTLDDPSYEGRFRTVEDRPIYVSDFEGNILHAPPPAQNIKESIDLLCEFANEDKEGEFIHPVIKGIILHFWLAYIHPFNDGNGRTARALFYWYMLKKNYWLFEYLSISNIILKVRTQYYRSFLYSEIDDGDMTYFIIFHLRAISTAIGQLKCYIKQKQEEARDVATQWRRYPSLNYRQKGVLNRGLANSEATFTFESHMRMYGVVHQTARTDLLQLVKAGLLEKNKKGRQFYFIPVKDLKDRLK